MSTAAEQAGALWHQNTQMRAYVTRGPRVIVAAEGAILKDREGREYVDGLSTHNCCSFGHGRREIVEAMAAQLRRLDFVSLQGLSHEPALDLAERLVALAPGDLAAAYFVNSGSEAVEAAFKLARQFFVVTGEPRRTKIISFRDAYHGHTLADTAAGGDTTYRLSAGPLPPGFVQIAPPGPGDDPVAAARVLEDALLFEGPQTVAAFILEPVAVHKGVRLFPPGYLAEVHAVCRRHGVLLIADEVISGLGRTGRLFACEHWGLEPDILTLGKALSGGYFPIGAALAHRRIRDAFWEREIFPHFVTYSGHPGGCAAALAALAIVEREDVARAAQARGEQLLRELTALQDSPVVGRVTGLGMLLSVELLADKATGAPLPPEIARTVASLALDLGLFCGIRGGHWLFLAPPLTMTDAEAKRLVSAVQRVIEEIGGLRKKFTVAQVS